MGFADIPGQQPVLRGPLLLININSMGILMTNDQQAGAARSDFCLYRLQSAITHSRRCTHGFRSAEQGDRSAFRFWWQPLLY